MKLKLSKLLTLLLLLVVQLSLAQEKAISGIVSDISDLPIPGVNIVVQGTTNGTQTDFDGKYTINANEGDILIFSYIGLKNHSVTVGAITTINVTMEEDASVLEEVIVTAQGIKKEKKALGYSVSTVSSKDIEQKADTDIGKILRGKAAGVRITGTGGASGSGSNIIIRGFSSITGGNQPLFIVDGVPFDGSSGGANQSSSSSAFQSGNVRSGFADIDPNNIESVSILKGLSATALYGGQGRNGVILITTKSGNQASRKTEITVNQSIFFNKINLPDYQDTYGGGFQNVYGPFFSNWGAPFSGQETIDNAFRTMVLNNFGVEPSVLFPNRPELDSPTVPYRAIDSQEGFFKTGVISNTSITVAGGLGDKGAINFAYSHVDDESFIPGNSLNRNNFSLGGTYKMDNKFTVSGKLSFAVTDLTSPFTDASTGSDVSISTSGTGGIASVWNVLYIPRSVTLDTPYQHPTTGESLWYRGGNDRMNPLWVVDNTKDENNTNRLFGNFIVSYDFTDWLKINYRLGIDNTNDRTTRVINRGANDGIHPNGYLQTTASTYRIWDHSLLANIDTKISEDFNLQATIGATTQRREFNRDGSESRDQIIFGLQNHLNFINSSTIIEGTLFADNNTAYQQFTEENNAALYTSATIGYKDFLYLNASIRNEWTSTLETDNRSQFSPGFSVSFIPTSAFSELRSTNGLGLNYLKLRAGYGTSPGFPGPYNTRGVTSLVPNVFQDAAGNGTTTTSVPNFLPNPDLKPELSKEFEFGVDGRFLDNRVGFEFTYYNRNTEDQIILRPLAPETGYTSQFTNIGKVINKGIEITADVTPVKTENINWKISGNFSQNKSEVQGLDDGEQILYGGIFATPANAAVNGEQLGVIFGTRVLRDDEGNRLVDENGYWIQDPTNGIIGDPNPDWFSTITNSFRYKNWTFNMQWEYQSGGDIYATTVGALVGRGVVGNFDRSQGVILPGIRQSTGLPNDIQLTATEAYFNNIGFGVDELLIYDASHIRLREASLSYNLPKKWLDKTPFGNISFTLVGQNLFVRALNVPKETNYDPEINSLGVGNSQGFDYLTSWNSRRYGMSVKITF